MYLNNSSSLFKMSCLGNLFRTKHAEEIETVEALLYERLAIDPAYSRLGRTQYAVKIKELFVDGINIYAGDGVLHVYSTDEPRGTLIKTVQIPRVVLEQAKSTLKLEQFMKTYDEVK